MESITRQAGAKLRHSRPFARPKKSAATGKGGCTLFALLRKGDCPLGHAGKGDSPRFQTTETGAAPFSAPRRNNAAGPETRRAKFRLSLRRGCRYVFSVTLIAPPRVPRLACQAVRYVGKHGLTSNPWHPAGATLNTYGCKAPTLHYSCEYAVGFMIRFVIFETVSLYFGSSLSVFQPSLFPNASQAAFWAASSGKPTM